MFAVDVVLCKQCLKILEQLEKIKVKTLSFSILFKHEQITEIFPSFI